MLDEIREYDEVGEQPFTREEQLRVWSRRLRLQLGIDEYINDPCLPERTYYNCKEATHCDYQWVFSSEGLAWKNADGQLVCGLCAYDHPTSTFRGTNPNSVFRLKLWLQFHAFGGRLRPLVDRFWP